MDSLLSNFHQLFKRPLSPGTRSRRSQDVLDDSPLSPLPSPSTAMTQSRCMCCDTTLAYPHQVTRFRCGVCETVNHLAVVVDPAPATDAVLTLQELAELVDKATLSNDYLDIDERLRRLFTSWQALTVSFSSNEPITLHHPGLVMADISQAWVLIRQLPIQQQTTVLSSMERLLRRPGRPITQLEDLKCLLLLLQCSLLSRTSQINETLRNSVLPHLVGLMGCLPNTLHRYLVNWLANYPTDLFSQQVELIGQFIACRLKITDQRKSASGTVIKPVAPSRISQQLQMHIQPSSNDQNNQSIYPGDHTILDLQSSGLIEQRPRSGHQQQQRSSPQPCTAFYTSDWKISAAARAMALFFAANNIAHHLPISEFYNTMVDLRVNLLADFDSWERRTSRFCFCQYPLLLSMSAKMTIMEFEARRQMYSKFREALIASFTHPDNANTPFVTLHIRRDRLVQDSLEQLSNMSLDLKKRIRIEFQDEEGIDAGGLTKEWLLLLVKDLFDPKYGMWLVDEDSNHCWFNPASLDLQEFYLVGVIVGLAVYHSTILDIGLPLACYKKLLGSPVDLSDLARMRPSLAHGLQALLDYEQEDVEEVFCRDFVAEYESFGDIIRVPLLENGENIVVNNENKAQFVALMVDFHLTESVARQFDLFQQGFMRVLQGNALSLFRPNEIELLVRGSTDIDMGQLQAVTEYDGFQPDDETIQQLWEILENYEADMKRRFMRFLTGTDRVPAAGTGHVRIKISCLGHEDSDRLPNAHTCFNQLGLYQYATIDKLRTKLTMAVLESEGFGIK